MRRTRVYARRVTWVSLGAALFLAGLGLHDARAQRELSLDKAYISRMLDAMHDAASKADGEKYFSYFSDGAVFLGTQGDERWAMREFKEYALPKFAEGKGWTYVSRTRHIYLNAEADAGWFDEILENEKYGMCRGSGAVVKDGFEWKIVQYNLTVPIPNELLPKVVEMIREHDKALEDQMRERRLKAIEEIQKMEKSQPGAAPAREG